MVVIPSSSSSSTSGDSRMSDPEKDAAAASWKKNQSSPSPRRSGCGAAADSEKKESQPHSQRGASECHDPNAVPVPGARPVEAESPDRGAAGDDDSASSVDDGTSEAVSEAQSGLGRVVSRVLSRTTSRSSWNPGPPPDGGTKAWLTVACAHLIIMNTWGFISSFGVFQTHYASILSLPPSDIAWIGSIQVFLLFFVGTFTGRLTDAGYFRLTFSTGAIFQILGIFTTAQGTRYWHFFLSQGVCMGLANGCLFCPTIAVVSTYFKRRRALAMGFTAAGTGTGGMVFPSIVRQLLPTMGFAWSMRVIGFIQIFALAVAFLGIRPRVPPRKGGQIVDWAAFKELEYTFYACGAFFAFMGVYLAFFYIVSFSRDVIGMSYTDSLNLLLVINGVGIVGRIGPNFAADLFGAINLFVVFAFLAGMVALCWTAVHDVAGVYVWAVAYGIAAGGIQSLFPAGLSSLTSDLRKTGVRLGMVFTIVSVATLAGPPIAGVIISRMGGSYVGAQVFAGATMLLGSAFMTASRVARTRTLGLGVWAKV